MQGMIEASWENRNVIGNEEELFSIFSTVRAFVTPSPPRVIARMNKNLWSLICGIKAGELMYEVAEKNEKGHARYDCLEALELRNKMMESGKFPFEGVRYEVEVDDDIPVKKILDEGNPWSTAKTTEIVFVLAETDEVVGRITDVLTR